MSVQVLPKKHLFITPLSYCRNGLADDRRKRAIIGSDTMLVAPVSIGDGALTASGSVITEDVPAEAVALARAKQVNKAGLATKLFERLRAIKAAKGKS